MIYIISIICFPLNKERLYKWIQNFVTTGPNRQIRNFNLKDLMEGNKSLKLPVIEDVINRFVSEKKIIMNIEQSTNRDKKYDFNSNFVPPVV